MSKKKRKHFARERVPTRPCPITHAGVEHVNYKDIELLKMFITEKGKIIPKRISGLSAKAQKKVTYAIKQARNAALLSFSEGFVVQDEVQE
jgi:small subunit ribosomal protein S18